MTLPRVVEDVLEALNAAADDFGVAMPVPQRVSVARDLAAIPSGSLTTRKVMECLAARGQGRVPRGFCAGVILALHEIRPAPSMLAILLEYRRFAIDALSAEFGRGRSKGHEGLLRDNLRTYLTSHAMVESRTGRGQTDIMLTELRCLIEVKVWTNVSTYEAGLEEVARYIHTARPAQAFVVVFCDRERLPSLVGSYDEPIIETRRLSGMEVPVILVPFEGDAPSKALSLSKQRERDG